MLIFGVLVGVLGGCPRPFDPEAAPKRQPSGAPSALDTCEQLFARSKLLAADACFERIGAGDEVQLYRGRIALRNGKPALAVRFLRPLVAAGKNEALRPHARYYLGLALLRQEAYPEADAVLDGLATPVGVAARLTLLIARAELAQQLRRRNQAIELLGRVFAESERPTERSWARDQLSAQLEHRTEAELGQEFARAERGTLFRALLADRLMRQARKRGAEAAATQVAQAATAALQRYFPAQPTPPNQRALAPSPTVLVALPLSGSARRAGRMALDAILAASGALRGTGLRLRIHDSAAGLPVLRAGSPSERIVGIVGGLGDRDARPLARLASAKGLPLASLSRASAGSYGLMPTGPHRARALARYALAQGARRAAILHPNTGYGRSLARAFAASIGAGGGRIVHQISYSAATRSFAPLLKAVDPGCCEALFVPDAATTLSLLVPALSAAGIKVSARRQTGPGHALLLSTADGLREDQLQRAPLAGAIVAPGFYAPAELLGAELGPRLRAYQQSLGRLPTVLEALAADALLVLNHQLAASRGGTTGGAKARKESIAGWTGSITFDSQGARSDPARLYRIEGEVVARIAIP